MTRNILKNFKKHKLHFLLLTAVSAIVYSCANMASPQGGDYDFDAPKIVKTTPALNSTDVTTNKIEIVFDELVQIENLSEKVIVTPPQKKTPSIQAISNKIKIELKDTLLPNTTYTIDFTDAIVDNNEGNPLENFAFSFSTGSEIDTLAISGKVLAANNLEPVKGIFVGLHKNLNDSAFTKIPFDRISRTNDKGEFTIRGIAEGNYKIYALDDINRSYIYENQANAIAFYDSIITPTHTRDFRTDTIFNIKTLAVDSVISIPYTRFLPDNIILRSFTSSFKRQYLQKHERPTPDELKIYFGAETDMPEIKPLNFADKKPDWGILERTSTNDSLRYWIIDPEVIKIDTLILQITYNATDSLDNIVSTVDTLKFMDRSKRRSTSDKKKKDDDKEDITFLSVQSNLKQTMNIYDTIQVTFERPIINFDENKFILQRLIDSTYIDETFKLIKDEHNPRKFSFIQKWTPGAEYKFSADSAAFYSYSGLWTNKIENKFRIMKADEYGDLYINILGLETNKGAFVELLDASDKPLRRATVQDREGELGALFMHLIPGKYYARITIDNNNNGVWDTGDYHKKIEPEMVYYYEGEFDIKTNWQKTESWTIDALSIDKQKPLGITKNKPLEKESKRKKLEKQEKDKREQEKKDKQSTDGFGTPQVRPST